MLKFILSFFFSLLLGMTSNSQTYSILELEQKAKKNLLSEQYEEANKILLTLQSKYFEQEDYASYMRTSTALAISLQKLEEYNASLPILQEALSHPQCQNLSDSLLAPAFHKQGVAYFFEGNDLLAIENWKEALNLRNSFLPKDHIDIIKGYRNIGKSYLFLKDWELAKSNLQSSLDLQLASNQRDTVYLAETYSELGDAYSNLEDYHQAEKYLMVGLKLYQSIFGEEEIEYYYVYENLFALYQKINQPKKMIDYAERVINIFEAFDEKYEEDHEILATNYNNLSIGYDLDNQINKALQSSNSAITNMKKSGVDAAEIYTNQSFLNRKVNDLSAALKSIEEAIKIDRTSDNVIGEAESLNSKAVILGLMGDYEKAISTVEEAIEKITRKEYILDKPLYVIALNDKASLLKKMANSNDKEDYLKKASLTYSTIISTIDNIRTGYISDASKSFLTNKSKKVLEEAMLVNIQLFYISKKQKYLKQAFELVERSKSIILFDALQEAQAKQTTNVPAKILERETQLKKEVAAKEKALFQSSQEESSNLNNDLIALNRSLEKLSDSLAQNYPTYHNAKYKTELPSITSINKAVSGSMIEYFVGDSTIYAFCLENQNSNITLTQIPIDFPLKSWIQQLRSAIYSTHQKKIRSEEQATAYADTLVQVAHQLYQKLIQPITEKHSLEEELLIIPDGILGYIPFDVLITKPVEESSLFGAHDYLIKDHQISYSYSSALLLEMKNKNAHLAKEQFAAFAPTFDKEVEMGFARTAATDILVPLDFNIPEVESIHQLIGGKLFTGKEATEENFNQYAPNYQILHLATHGKANDLTGDYAYLAFTQIPDSIENEFLYNRDLYNLQLNADVVVLSACETGIGELQKGEGIISLARGFSYAGAKSIITTLWSINDSKTKEIMESFYTFLKEGYSKDKALREAKLAFIDKYSHNAHPFYWAAFIPIGDMSPIEISTNWIWQLMGGLGIFLLGVLFFFKKIKK